MIPSSISQSQRMLSPQGIYFVVFSLWTFLVAAFPGDFSQLKKIIGVVVLILAALWLWTIRTWKLSPPLLILWLLTSAYFIFSALRSELNSYPIDVNLLQNIILNLLIIPVAAAALTQVPKGRLITLLTLLAWTVTLMSLAYIFHRLGFFDSPLFDLRTFGSVKTEESFLEFRLTSHNSLFYLFPIFAFHAMSIKGNFGTYFLLFLMIIVIALSGRRALQVIAIATMVFIYAKLFINIKSTRLITGTFLAIILGATIVFALKQLQGLIGLENIFETILRTIYLALDPTSSSTSKRIAQSGYLLDLWQKNVFFGEGLASYSHEYIRDFEFKWSYELVYLAFFAQNGIVGVGLLLVLIWATYIHGAPRVTKNVYLIALGLYFIAGSTNPFVYYSWPWIISLTLAKRS